MKNRTVSAGERLNSYFANVKATNLADALKRSAANWQVYAAVTGSAIAMATNASAGVIKYINGPNVTASLGHNLTSNQTSFRANTNVGVAQNRTFSVGVQQRTQATSLPHGTSHNRGIAFISAGVAFDFLTSNGSIKKLASGAGISAGAAVGGVHFQSGLVDLATQPGFSPWPAGQLGFAGFRFSTSASNQTDYGWIRLEYTVGSNGLANSITATDWAYDTTGAPITAGDVGAPEPSTTALAILAAGAAGVAALRRRRNASA